MVRDLTVDRIHESEMRFGTSGRKRVAYLSMEFLVGRLLMANLINLDLAGVVEEALRPLDTSLLELAEFEPDAGLGNGGLGRLAACFLESLATHGYPATGYGICYSHGMFRQEIVEGRQVERLDNWLRSPSPWMIARSERTVPVHFFGRVENGHGNGSGFSPRWIETDVVLGIPRDIPIVGFGGGFANVLRLWSATSTAELDLELFNHGDYVGAAKKKVQSESISKILYPNDHVEKGRELRLMQEYFFVACSVADVLHDLRAKGLDLHRLPDFVAFQLNDTHPALTVVELMRILVDVERLDWADAWDLVVRCVGYTNHTLLPEALEKWPATMLGNILPRHLQLIREIDRRFVQEISERAPDIAARVRIDHADRARSARGRAHGAPRDDRRPRGEWRLEAPLRPDPARSLPGVRVALARALQQQDERRDAAGLDPPGEPAARERADRAGSGPDGSPTSPISGACESSRTMPGSTRSSPR